MLWIPRNPFGKWHNSFQSYSIVGKTISLCETFCWDRNELCKQQENCSEKGMRFSCIKDKWGIFLGGKKPLKALRYFPLQKLLLNWKL